MIDDFPIEILNMIIKQLDYKSLYNLVLTNNEFKKLYSEYLKENFFYLFPIKYINNDLSIFRENIILLNETDRNKVLMHAINNIDTVWLNKEQGFYNMKYILECMLIGCEITIFMEEEMNYSARHFYDIFYMDLLNCLKKNNQIQNRENVQKKINNVGILRSLHSNFIPFKKYD